MAIGLGFVPDVIVDQHFHNRNRMARLISAIDHATQPSWALALTKIPVPCLNGDGSFQVIGKGSRYRC
jgi:cyanophycinase